MADAVELCSLAELKTYLNVTSGSKDALLTTIKSQVEQAVKTYCDRDFLNTQYTEVYDGDGGILLNVRNRPITSIISIFSDPTRIFASQSQIPSSDIISDDAIALRAGIVRLFLYRYLRGNRSTQITYWAGYSVIPVDLTLAVKLICARTWQVQDKALFVEKSRQAGNNLRIDLATDLWPKDAIATLDKYRRVTL